MALRHLRRGFVVGFKSPGHQGPGGRQCNWGHLLKWVQPPGAVSDCTDSSPSAYAILASYSTVSGNQIFNCTNTGIWGYCSTISNNVVNNCGNGIYGAGTISGNTVTDCGTGIFCYGGPSSAIGNTVTTASGQTGFNLSTSTSYPIMMDQNTVGGAGTHYAGGSSATVWAGSSGATASAWGNNAGHP